MANHFHDAGNLVCCHKTPSLTLGDDLIRHSVFLGLEYCCLVKTDGGGMNAHIGEDDVHIIHASWDP